MARAFNTRYFFDKTKVASFLDRKTKRALGKYGAFVRRSAQFSMRNAGKGKTNSAKPGEAPRAHGQKELKRLLFFTYDPIKKSVVIGPVRLGRTANQHVPLLQEVGGTKDVRTNSGKIATLTYAPHPYIGPAALANRGVIAKAYADAV